jgi:acyl-coenzyme A synthetase/AMP-(fatty) acid ligase
MRRFNAFLMVKFGEIVVGGVGVSGGYFRNPERTSTGFISASHLCAGRVYRTGDLGRRNAAGLLECLGRRDNEVKISGQRVELESVERCLLNTGVVSAAAALRVAEQQTGGFSTLVAYVVARNGKAIDSASVYAAYRRCAPYLIASRVRIASVLPLTAYGKVDRRQLAQQYMEDLRRIMQGQKKLSTHYESRETHLQQIWGEVLGIDPASIKQDDSFFAMGGT